jgi:hypothetical protein
LIAARSSEYLVLIRAPTGKALESQAWEALPMSGKILLNLLQPPFEFSTIDVGKPRDIGLSIAEVYLLNKVVSRTMVADIVRRLDPFQYIGDLTSFVKRQCDNCEKFEIKTSSFVSSSLTTMLSSLFFRSRPKVVKVPRAGTRLETAEVTPNEQAVASEPIFGFFSFEPTASSLNDDMPAFLASIDADFDVESVFERTIIEGVEGSDRTLAEHFNVVLNHEPFDDNLETSLQYMSDHDLSQRPRRARTTLVQLKPEITQPLELYPCPYEKGAFVSVLARTFAGVSPRESTSFTATFLRLCDDPQFCFVVPVLEGRCKTKVLMSRLIPACMDGLQSMSRFGRPSSQAIKRVRAAELAQHQAEQGQRQTEITAAQDAKRARAELKKVKKTANVRVRRAYRTANSQVKVMKEKLTAAVKTAVRQAKEANLATDELRAVSAKAKWAAARLLHRTITQCRYIARQEAKKAKQQSRKEIASFQQVSQRAERDACIAAADADELRKGRVAWQRRQVKDAAKDLKLNIRIQTRVAFEDAAIKNRRLEAALEHERRMGEKSKAAFAKVFSDVEDNELHLRNLKNEMAKRARLAEGKLLRLRQAKANMDKCLKMKSTAKLPVAFRERLDNAQADVIAAEVAMEALQEEIVRLRQDNCDLAQAHRLLKLKLGASRVNFQNLPIGNKSQSTKIELWRLLGVRGESYCQDVIELGLTLMAAQLSAEQAVDVLRAFLRLEYPEKIEGADYRIPEASRFREWRRYLEPICHFVGLSVIKLSDRAHVSHDATTKNGVHVLQTCVRCEIKNEIGEIMVVDVPLKFEICPSGEAKHEARHISEAFHSPLLGGLHAALTSVVSATSDNAARATSHELEILKAQEVEAVRRLLTPVIGQIVDEYPPELQAAVEAFLAMTPEQQQHAHEMHELGCTGHSLNLTVDDCWSKSEASTLTANMVRHRAALVLTRAVISRARRLMRKKDPKHSLHFCRYVWFVCLFVCLFKTKIEFIEFVYNLSGRCSRDIWAPSRLSLRLLLLWCRLVFTLMVSPKSRTFKLYLVQLLRPSLLLVRTHRTI